MILQAIDRSVPLAKASPGAEANQPGGGAPIGAGEIGEAAIVEASGLSLSLDQLFKIPAQPFDPECVDLVRQAATRLGLSWREIVSGAAHDAVYVAKKVPTAMIFTPCKDGLSHNEAESVLPEEAEAGCQVLLEVVVARANRSLTPAGRAEG